MIYLGVFFFSIVSTFLIRELATKRSILDHPNSRSSHTIATPTGGGMAIVLSFYLGTIYLYFNLLIESELFFALLCGILLVVISFIDDLKELSVGVRLVAQLISLVGAFYFLGLFETFVFYESVPLFISSLWLINLYNFMDGIDGYAASEAIFVSFGAYFIYGDSILLILAFSVVGFLLYNWQRASIFMGDVGSTFLGFVFAVFAIYNYESIYDLMIWYILLGVFIFDATFTLICRIKAKEKLSVAHKKHTFQKLTMIGFSHSKVTFFAMCLNILILFLVVNVKTISSIFLIFIGYNALLYFIVKYIDKKKGMDV